MRGGKLLNFSTLLWVCVVLAVAWLLGMPLAMNWWAGSHWTKVECQKGTVIKDSTLPWKYVYQWKDQVYISGRRDVWEMGGKADKGIDWNPKGVSDGVCWVDPNDPEFPVHYLDAPTNWTGATQRVVVSLMLVIVAGMVQFVEHRRRREKRLAAAQAGRNA